MLHVDAQSIWSTASNSWTAHWRPNKHAVSTCLPSPHTQGQAPSRNSSRSPAGEARSLGHITRGCVRSCTVLRQLLTGAFSTGPLALHHMIRRPPGRHTELPRCRECGLPYCGHGILETTHRILDKFGHPPHEQLPRHPCEPRTNFHDSFLFSLSVFYHQA